MIAAMVKDRVRGTMQAWNARVVVCLIGLVGCWAATEAAGLQVPRGDYGRLYRRGAAMEASGAQATPAGDMKVSRDIRYAEVSGVDPRLLSLDVYQPK